MPSLRAPAPRPPVPFAQSSPTPSTTNPSTPGQCSTLTGFLQPPRDSEHAVVPEHSPPSHARHLRGVGVAMPPSARESRVRRARLSRSFETLEWNWRVSRPAGSSLWARARGRSAVGKLALLEPFGSARARRRRPAAAPRGSPRKRLVCQNQSAATQRDAGCSFLSACAAGSARTSMPRAPHLARSPSRTGVGWGGRVPRGGAPPAASPRAGGKRDGPAPPGEDL